MNDDLGSGHFNRRFIISRFTLGAIFTYFTTGISTLRAQNYTKTRQVFVDDFVQEGSGTQSSADSIALRKAIASDADKVILAPRRYLLDTHGLCFSSQHGKYLIGVKGRTIIEQSEPRTDYMVSFQGGSNIYVSGVEFNGAGHLLGTNESQSGYPGFQPCLLVNDVSGFRIEECAFSGFSNCALLVNASRDGRILDCYVNRGVAEGRYPNYGIAVLGGSERVVVARNKCEYSQIAIDASYSTIRMNEVSKWGFSAGINISEDIKCNNLIIDSNRCFDSHCEPDRDGYFLDGIECWGFNSIISNNFCHNNIGNGITIGASNCVVERNLCLNNGVLNDNVPIGCGIRSLSDSINGSNSLLKNNRCGNTPEFGAPVQAFGYGQNSRTMTGIRLENNSFMGNLIADLDLSRDIWSIDTSVNDKKATVSRLFAPQWKDSRIEVAVLEVEEKLLLCIEVSAPTPPSREYTVIYGLPVCIKQKTKCSVFSPMFYDLDATISAKLIYLRRGMAQPHSIWYADKATLIVAQIAP